MSKKSIPKSEIMGGEAFFAALLAAAKGDKETTYQIMRKLADDILSKYKASKGEE